MAVLDAGFALKRHLSGRGVLVVDANGIAQPWPGLPPQMERFLDLTFLVVRREGAQVTECWCPDEAVKQELAVLGWPEEGIWNGGQVQAGREYWTPSRRLQRLSNQKLLLGLGRLKFKVPQPDS